MDPSSVGDTLYQLRRQRRLSQNDLAELSGVSQSAIKLVESGQSNPKPATLRLLATGLASGIDGKVDEGALETVYGRLMRAAGYWHQSAGMPEESGVNREAFLREMAEKHGEPIAVALSTVAWDYDTLPRTYQRLIESALLALSESTPDEERHRKRR